MKNGFRYLFIPVVFMILGYVLGVVLHPRLLNFRVQDQNISTFENGFLSDTMFDVLSGRSLRLNDTLAHKGHNLLVFWSPTCSYSKQFFLHQLNNQVVGIYCFPLTDDWEYLRYYVDTHQIVYPQIAQPDHDGIKSLDLPSITAVPTFIVVDSLGQQLASFVGINKMEELMNILYYQKTE